MNAKQIGILSQAKFNFKRMGIQANTFIFLREVNRSLQNEKISVFIDAVFKVH